MTDVIRRKIERARPASVEGAPGADRGWRLALARATRDAMGLDLDVSQLTVRRLSVAELLETAPDRALLGLLDGPKGGLGVIMIAPLVTAALIEMQTFGRLSAQAAPVRKPSRIDAAMVAGVIDRALAGLEEALAEEADLVWAGGFRYASHLEEARSLGLLLEEDLYRVLTTNVSLANGAREGQVILVLPAIGRGDRSLVVPEDTSADAPYFTAALNERVMETDCRMDAVIGRLRLSISQIMSLQVGEVLALPSASLEAVTLDTIDGRRVSEGRLGQHRGMRALKLSDAAHPRAQATPPLSAAKPIFAPPDLELPENPETAFRAAG